MPSLGGSELNDGTFPDTAPACASAAATAGVTQNSISPAECTSTSGASASASASASTSAEPTTSMNESSVSADVAASLDPQRIFFPLKLHDIVSDASTDDIVRWLPSGKAFIIADKKRFASEILPRCFQQNCQFTSFTRKLTRWRFNRIPRGPLIGAYYHKLFVQGCRDMCYHMTCKSEATRSRTAVTAIIRGSGGASGVSETSASVPSAIPKQITHAGVGMEQQQLPSSPISSKSSTPSLFGGNMNISIPTLPVAQPLELPQLPTALSTIGAATAINANTHTNTTTALENGLKELVQVDACIRILQQANETQLLLQQAQQVHQAQLAKERDEALHMSIQTHLNGACTASLAANALTSSPTTSTSNDASTVLDALKLIQSNQDLLTTISSLARTT